VRRITIVTPVWQSRLEPDDVAFLRITERTNQATPRVFVAPEGLDTAEIERSFPSWLVVRTSPSHLISQMAYSAWLLSPDFYRQFPDSEFLAICQLDAVLVRDLQSLDLSNLDYVGAPWRIPLRVLQWGKRFSVASSDDARQGPFLTRIFGRRLYVGNGGLSLRRTQAFEEFTTTLEKRTATDVRRNIQEDAVISAYGPRLGLRIADRRVAESIFQETQVIGETQLPAVYGFHALRRWNPGLADQLIGDAANP
jgi:hypothetical protein